jgi:hypothetical protein
MTRDAPTMVLRLSVPAGGEFPKIAADLAARVAEHLGGSKSEAKATGESIHALVAEVAPHRADAAERAGQEDVPDITFEFHQIHGALRIEARCAGRSSEARHPLPT